MNKLYYCTNCINNGLTITIPDDDDEMFIFNDENIVNGFIIYQSFQTDHYRCPYCGNWTVELSLTVDEWEILKQISIETNFIFQMDYLKKTNIIDFNLKLSQFKANISVTQELRQSAQQSSIPHCPTCGSIDIEKISGAKRWLTTGLFGLASSNIGKSIQCKSCGYKW